MRIGFLASDKPREQLLADAFLRGAARHGHSGEVHALRGEPFVGDYHLAVMVGVKSRELWRAHQRAGVPVVYLDKGYCRQKRTDGVAGWEYWRVSINDHHPTARLAVQKLPVDRWRSLGITVQPWRSHGRQIIIAGSSAKYHDFYDLRDPTRWTRTLVGDLRALTKRPIVYRPKPSWRDAMPVPKTRLSGPSESIGQVLAGAWCLVTHGSNACFEAMVAGVPCIVFGNGIARPISSTSVADIEAPRLATDKQRNQLLANLAWWQWTAAEFAAGDAWDFIGDELHAAT